MFQGGVAFGAIERDAAQRGAHFQQRETGFAGSVKRFFAGAE